MNEQPRTKYRRHKRNEKNETRVSGNKSKSNHTHTSTETMFKNITKSVFFCRWRFGHRPLAERYSVSFSRSVGHSFVRFFFGFLFSAKALYEWQEMMKFRARQFKIVLARVWMSVLAYCILLSVMRVALCCDCMVYFNIHMFFDTQC